MSELCPYLNFNGNCREAMTFYQSILGGELNFISAGESPMAEQMPPDMKDQILHSTLTKGSVTILLSSDAFGSEVENGNAFHLSFTCQSEDHIRSLFGKLSNGGKVNHPLEAPFWGGLFTMITDKFGKNWMLSWDGK